MKIAFIVNEFPSLAGTPALNQITGLIDRGYDVDIFTEVAGYDRVIHEDVKKYNLLEKLSIKAYPKIKSLGFLRV